MMFYIDFLVFGSGWSTAICMIWTILNLNGNQFLPWMAFILQMWHGSSITGLPF